MSARRDVEPAWRSIIGDNAELVHSYTMADLDRITRHCVSAAKYGARALDLSERWASAYHGVVEALYSAEQRPTYGELFDAGAREMAEELRLTRRQSGSNQRHPDHGSAPMFIRYWVPVGEAGFEEKVIEPLALAQMLGELSPKLYEAVSAAAVHETRQGAADALGITRTAFQARLREARKILIRLWHEHETPVVSITDTTSTCKSGHAWSQYGRVTPAGNRWCLLCSRRNNRRQRARGGAA